MFIWPSFWHAATPPSEQDAKGKEEPKSLTSYLHYYTTPGVTPPSARTDPKLKLQERHPIRLWHLWKYGIVAAVKTTEITGAILRHCAWGPLKKSWGIEMTLINTLMRGAGRHSALVDITTIRMLMGLAGLAPLPSDALVTPVTFSVRRRQLRGILASFDQQETGRRELSGEWVVGRQTWLRLQDEWKSSQTGGTNHRGSNDRRNKKKKKERVVLYIHGGAYYASSSAAQRMISIPLAKYLDARVFALDYRLAPETQFPGPLHDAVSAYFRLVNDLHIPHDNIILAGDSAGGGLTLALLMYLRDNHYALPSAAILMSPWVDLTMSCESWDSNEPYDVIPMPAPDDHLNPVALYLGDNMEQYLTHPYASPLFGDFTGLPPLLIQAGDSEKLRDEITLLSHKASLAGVEVRHELYEDAIHVFQLYPFLDAATRSFISMRDFVRKFLPQIERPAPQKLDKQAEKVLETEIENDRVIMVGGDGLEIASGLDGVKQSVSKEAPALTDSSSDTEEEGAPSRAKLREYPSWGRRVWNLSSPFTLFTPSSDRAAATPIRRRRAGTMPSTSFSEARPSMPPSRPSYTRSESSQYSRHQRTQSSTALGSRRSGLPPRISLPPVSSVTPPPQSPVLSPTNSVPPSPSLRRSSRASSHHDLSSLVKDWTQGGPANRTFMYH